MIGIDIGSGKPPSLTEMMKLAADAEFREAVTLMKLEMKNAGVDMENPVCCRALPLILYLNYNYPIGIHQEPYVDAVSTKALICFASLSTTLRYHHTTGRVK